MVPTYCLGISQSSLVSSWVGIGGTSEPLQYGYGSCDTKFQLQCNEQSYLLYHLHWLNLLIMYESTL